MIYLYCICIAIITSIGLYWIVHPYLNGRTKKKQVIGLTLFFFLYGIQDFYLSILEPKASLAIEFWNFVLFYGLSYLILHFFFKNSGFVKFIMFFTADFLFQAIGSVFAFSIAGIIYNFNMHMMVEKMDSPSIYNTIFFIVTTVLSVAALIPIMKWIRKKEGKVIHIIATCIAMVDIVVRGINGLSSLNIVMPVMLILVLTGLFSFEIQIQKTNQLIERYKKIEHNMKFKKEDLNELKEDILAHLSRRNETQGDVYLKEILQNIDEKMDVLSPIEQEG